MKAVYKFMPTCAYVIAGITVEKDGTMVWDERTDQDTIEAVIIALAAAGFNPVKDEDEEETGLTIEIPLEKVSVGNLTKLLDAKGELIKKALGIEDTRIELKEDRIAFPWYLITAAVLATIAIAFVSIIGQTLKVARRNPIKSIRTE